MVIDLTGPRMDVSFRGDPDKALAVERHRAQAPKPTSARVTGYVVVKEDMVFCAGKDYVTLPVGSIVELVQPSERDRKDLERFHKLRQPHAMIRWAGLSRCVPSKGLARSDAAAWNEQQHGRKPSDHA